MRSQKIESPRLLVKTAEDFPVSGDALLELMRAVLAKGVPFRFRARGWSMAPFIKDGDVITVSPLRGKPGIGEIVAFLHPHAGKLIVHRVISNNGPDVFIQGDSIAAQTDGIVPNENLIGRVTRIERDGRRTKLGLGPERWLIARLSRARLLIPIRDLLVNLLRS